MIHFRTQSLNVLCSVLNMVGGCFRPAQSRGREGRAERGRGSASGCTQRRSSRRSLPFPPQRSRGCAWSLWCSRSRCWQASGMLLPTKSKQLTSTSTACGIHFHDDGCLSGVSYFFRKSVEVSTCCSGNNMDPRRFGFIEPPSKDALESAITALQKARCFAPNFLSLCCRWTVGTTVHCPLPSAYPIYKEHLLM